MKHRFLFLTVTGLLNVQTAWSHTRLLPTGTLVPRNTSSGNKTSPCGVPRTNSATSLIAGQQLLVQFEETINHPGHFRIAFSPAADTGFDQNVLADNLPHDDVSPLPREYSHTITVPNMACDQCTIQVVQYMTETTPPTLYYSCADVTIKGSATPSPSPAPSPSPPVTPIPSVTPTVAPSPSPVCP